MSSNGVSVAIVGDPKHVLYLTGYLTGETHSSAAVLYENGTCVLIAPTEEENLAIDQLVAFEASALCTLRLDQPQKVAEQVRSILGSGCRRRGLDKGGASGCLGELLAEAFDLGPDLVDLRRSKDKDELAILRRGIELTHSCYARALEIIEPGVSELEVYSELYSHAVSQAGEKIPAMGNDFQANSPGGPPRPRKAQPGELYILDLGVELSGYFADNSRTFSVDGNPSTVQRKAWRDLVEVFTIVEERVKPGYSCGELYREIKGLLDADWPGSFFHHLGHGVGLYPHERPNLNPRWNQTFREGDFFTVEPGIYEKELSAGIRLEENYRVTSNGVEKLTSFPLDL
jgi:Xaa-Pro aminopeptidase